MASVPPAAWLVVALAAGTASAQEPADPWRSAFDGYRPFKDEKTVPWRAANDTVGRIGGWRAYAREATAAAAPASAAASGSKPGAMHSSHQGTP